MPRLTYAQLRALLHAASTASERERVAIQIRLNRAIPGMRETIPARGPIAEKAAKLDALFAESKPEDLVGLAGEFWELIKGNS